MLVSAAPAAAAYLPHATCSCWEKQKQYVTHTQRGTWQSKNNLGKTYDKAAAAAAEKQLESKIFIKSALHIHSDVRNEIKSIQIKYIYSW